MFRFIACGMGTLASVGLFSVVFPTEFAEFREASGANAAVTALFEPVTSSALALGESIDVTAAYEYLAASVAAGAGR